MAQLLFREDPYLRSCEATVVATRDNLVELDRTVFYPAGGGQPGDTGRIAEARVIDTLKGEGEWVLHVIEPGAALPAPGASVVAEIDWERRHRHMRFHTALHLLGAV
ncbi:MAG: alanine--tRNA ligase-related protein, partial [Burkholderiales bacterium]